VPELEALVQEYRTCELTADQEAMVRAYAPRLPRAQIARHLGVSVATLTRYYQAHGLIAAPVRRRSRTGGKA